MSKNILKILLVVLYSYSALAEVTVILSFTPPKTRVNGDILTQEELAGMKYKVYAGTKSKDYTYEAFMKALTFKDGKYSNQRIVPFSPEEDIYFMATAIDSNGLESAPSDEVIRKGKIKLLPPGVPEIIGSINNAKYIALIGNNFDLYIDEQNKVAHISEELAYQSEAAYNNEYQIAGYMINGETYKVEIH